MNEAQGYQMAKNARERENEYKMQREWEEQQKNKKIIIDKVIIEDANTKNISIKNELEKQQKAIDLEISFIKQLAKIHDKTPDQSLINRLEGRLEGLNIALKILDNICKGV